MKKVFGLLIVFALFAAAQGQPKPRKVVVWSGDKGCGFVSRSIPQTELPECSNESTPRGPVSVIRHSGLGLSVAFIEEDGYIILAAQIENKTETPLDIDTDLWGAAHYASVEDFAKGRKPIVAETSIPSRDIVREIKAAVRMDDTSDTFMASITKASETKEVRRPDGTRVKQVVIVDDAEAQRTAGSRKLSRAEFANAEQLRIRQNAITQKWVAAGEKIRGLVYFRRIKKARFVVFSLGLLDTSYVFRLPRNKTK